ncbi:MAG: nitroreductase family protein, partial [Candidatus Gracilibacteria bacterium]
MDALEAIYTRRSIRKYKANKVSQDLIDQILKAGFHAPSAGGAETRQFIVIDDPKILSAIPDFSPYAEMAKEAPLAILVCAEPHKERYKDFWPQDCAAAVENMLVAINALGLGAVWTAAYVWEDRIAGYRKLLNIPQEIIPFALIVIG